jgi:cytochrome b subunit of formate dehydrogenase
MENNVCKDILPKEDRHSKKVFVYRPPIYIKDGKKYFYRFTLVQRIMHVILFSSVLTLIGTGVPLKYANAPFLRNFYSLIGGVDIVPMIHRWSGATMCLLFVVYIFYFLHIYYHKYVLSLRKTEGATLKCWVKAFLNLPMVPELKDATDIIQNMKYLLFLSDKKPEYGKFMWKEKFDFFAVFWGIPILGISGLLLWKRELLSHIFPGIAFNLAIIAHSDEALLAATFLIIVHLYNTHLHIHKFPMGTVFITGYLSEHEMVEEHYAEYVNVMRQEGFEDEIKPFYESHHREHISTKFIRVFYSLTVMALLISISVVVLKLTVFSVHGFFPSEGDRLALKHKSEQTELFEKRIMESSEKEKHYLGYRILEEQKIKGHFHHIGLDVLPDKRSACIRCHGDLPHEKLREVRAFLNMHASFFACEVCHGRQPREGKEDVRPKVFKWYAKKDGKIVDEPIGALTPDKKVNFKITPLIEEGNTLSRFDSDESLKIAEDYLKAERTLSPLQKTQAQRVIHKYMSEKPAKCRDCHNQKESYLPFEKLGYAEPRIKELKGTAIVGMLEKYEKFYLPDLFKPAAEKKEALPWLRAVK